MIDGLGILVSIVVFRLLLLLLLVVLPRLLSIITILAVIVYSGIITARIPEQNESCDMRNIWSDRR